MFDLNWPTKRRRLLLAAVGIVAAQQQAAEDGRPGSRGSALRHIYDDLSPNDCEWGKMLRRMRIDEFPQLLNIVKGDMNIIGPRPERPEFVKGLSEKIPFYDVRHVIKPGLTGWAQVNHNYGTSHDDALIKLQYDLYYIKNRSLFLDLSIYIKTLTTVLFLRGQ